MEKIGTSASTNDSIMIVFVFLLPTFMLVVGYFLFPYPPSSLTQQLGYAPLFLGLLLIGIGFLWKKQRTGSKIKILGWIIFSFYWATTPSYLYLSEEGDVFNTAICIIGVYVLVYLGYHEWLSLQKNEYPSSLNWIAGSTVIAGMIYFTIDSGVFPGLREWFIHVVAQQSTMLLNLFGVNAYRQGSIITYNTSPVTIIFACTAIQSLVLFVGMNGALKKISLRRRSIAILITALPVYFLNLIRNASVIFLVGGHITSFEMAHNVIFKILALVALVILLFINFKLVPELYDEIIGIIDLPKRKGPVELFVGRLLGKKHDTHR
jgi:archaeosortase A (PGF-CTERM-specific)